MHILEILRPNEFVSGEEIAGLLKVSRAAVHKQIEKLRRSGYAITGTNNSGYILLSRPDLVTPEEIKFYLEKEGVAPHSVFYFNAAGSTQDEAKKIAAGEVKMPALVIAESQTGSYGRRRRQWASPPGGLWFSLIIKPDIAPEKIAQLTFAASLAVSRAVEVVLGFSPLIKWPNDVTLDGRKFCGVLTEISAEVGRLNWAVLGIGINVNNTLPAELAGSAVSLSSVSGGKINRAELLAGFLSEFYGLYDVFLEKGFQGFRSEYNKKSLLNGMKVKIESDGGVLEGTAAEVDPEGYLLVKSNGRKVKVMAGDIITARGK